MKRRPFLRVRLMLDRCAESWKVAPCAAAGATPCYRTRTTCQDAANYNPAAAAFTLLTAHQAVPPGYQGHPCVVDVEHVPTKIDMKAGLGRRDQIVIECDDFEDAGELLDPYFTRRPTWSSRCSFFSRLKAVHKHAAGRIMYVDEGTLEDDGTMPAASLTTRRYVIERIDLAPGRATIVAKDVLWKLENATVPAPSVGELAGNVTAVASSFAVVTGDGAAYGTAPFTVRIDDEIITVGARATDTFSTLTRGAWGTTAAAHDAAAKVQICATWEDESPDTIWADLLDYGGIAAADIDTAGAATEAAVWFAAYNLSGCISEPTRVADVVADLVQQISAFTWWDADAQLVRFKGIHPADPDDTTSSIDDAAHVVQRSVSVREQDAERISRVDCYYGLLDWAKGFEEPANYARRIIAIDASAESAAEYNEVRDTRKLWCYFCPSTLEAEVEQLAARVLDRYRDAPRFVSVDLEMGDATTVPGELVTLTTRELVDADGAAKATSCWALSRARQGGDAIVYRYELMVDYDAAVARWAFVNYDAAPGYDAATDEDKTCAYVADDTTEKVGDDPPYVVI